MLTGAVLVRATYEGAPVTAGFLDDIIQRVLDHVDGPTSA